MGDEDIMSLTDLTGEDSAGAPWVALIVAGHAGDGEERGQVVFSGEAAGEPAGESVLVRESPILTSLV